MGNFKTQIVNILNEVERNREIYNKLNFFLRHTEEVIHEFEEIILNNFKLGDNSQGSNLKLLKELIILDDISSANFKRLQCMTKSLMKGGNFTIANHNERRILQELIVKTNTSLELISKPIQLENEKIANLVDNTLRMIDELPLITAS